MKKKHNIFRNSDTFGSGTAIYEKMVNAIRRGKTPSTREMKSFFSLDQCHIMRREQRLQHACDKPGNRHVFIFRASTPLITLQHQEKRDD